MTEHDEHHCPFLNRADSRCTENFRLDHLQHAFKFCFDRYKACPSYLELLVERRVRRTVAGATASMRYRGENGPYVQVTIGQTALARSA